jgi:hypothetical protein
MQGAVSDVVAVLKELPAAREMLENKDDWKTRVGVAQMLAGLVSKDADKDPAAVLASVNAISGDIAAWRNGGKENSEAQAELRTRISMGFSVRFELRIRRRLPCFSMPSRME